MGIDPASIQNPRLRAAIEAAAALAPVRPPKVAVPASAAESGTVYTISAGLLQPSISKKVSVPGLPVSKPRMTQRDQWMKRPAVLRYRDYCDRIRSTWAAQAGALPDFPDGIAVVAFLPVSASWSAKKKAEHVDCGHRLKPDGDNILKAVCDALVKEDSCLWVKWIVKLWCAENDARTDITVLWYE